MNFYLIMIAAGLLLWASARIWSKRLQLRRAAYIENYSLPQGLFVKLRKKHPNLAEAEFRMIDQALRQFYIAYLLSGCRFVSMPSQAADDLWHEWILYTKMYANFCRKAFGRFLHHTPAAVLGSHRQSNAGLRRCWWHACKLEGIDPKKPGRLPLLFALDQKLQIADGFYYTTDCKCINNGQNRTSGANVIYCGGDFSSSDFDGTTDGFGESSSNDSGSGDSGGCNGGCSGGCGGD